jgi:hypothetical protein
VICKFCGGPCPAPKNPTRPRLFCTNAHRAAWRIQERNRAIEGARDALQQADDVLAGMRSTLQTYIDTLDGLIILPRESRKKRSG